jgi:t-SNARE complex subunit (syntaxin)
MKYTRYDLKKKNNNFMFFIIVIVTILILAFISGTILSNIL